MSVKLPLLYVDRDRHGNQRIFVRAATGNRRKVRIRATFSDAHFMQAYSAAMAELGQANRDGPELVKPNSLQWLASSYFGSATFRGLDAKTQRVRVAVIESCLREPIAPGSDYKFAGMPLRLFGPKHVRILRDRIKDKPAAANNRRKYLSSMFGWAFESDLVDANPCRGVERLKYQSDGFKPWSERDLDAFERAYPIGTKQRLALALLLFTGARRSDVVELGPSNVRNSPDGQVICFVPKKTRKVRRDATPKPYLPELARIIAATKLTGRTTFLVTDYGKQFSVGGFGDWFRRQCRKIGLDDCSAHGLRKLGAIRAAMSGATHYQLQSVFDWATPSQAEPYIKLAERAKGAAAAMKMLAQRQ